MKKEKAPLCPNDYTEMKPIYNQEGLVIYHKCPKCGMQILFAHSGHWNFRGESLFVKSCYDWRLTVLL